MNKAQFHFKKDKSIEMKLYELLGIKVFKKMAFFVRDIVTLPLTFKMPKEERKKSLYNTASNYNIGKSKSLEDIKKFKKQLFKNAGIHIFALLAFIPSFIKIIIGMASLSTTIIVLPAMVMNIYCIMLQRYNCIRINQLIEKMTPRYEKQKDAIKEELIEKDSLLLEHSYKIIDKKEKENLADSAKKNKKVPVSPVIIRREVTRIETTEPAVKKDVRRQHLINTKKQNRRKR